MTLRGEIRLDEAEPEACGGSTVEDENEVWPDLLRNPSGRGQFFSFPRRSSLRYTRYLSLLASRNAKNRLPALLPGNWMTGPKPHGHADEAGFRAEWAIFAPGSLEAGGPEGARLL